MLYKAIVAYCANKGIGNDNALPWNIKSDLGKFSKLTKGNGNNAIVMGKNTWLSIPNAPLPGRENLILSRSLKIEDLSNEIDNTIVKIFNNIDELNLYCRENFEEIWLIGGGQVYKAFLDRDMIKEMYVTYINKIFNCDIFFPDFDERKWSIMSELHKSKATYDFDIYDMVYTRENKNHKS